MKLPVQNVKSWAWPTRSDLDYYRSRLVDPAYTGNESSAVENEIGNLVTFATDAFSSPNTIAGRSYTLPTVWPVKYTPDVVARDLTITYDTSGGGQDANGNWVGTLSLIHI